MVIPESHFLKNKTAVVSVIPNRYYFKNVFFVAVIPKLYFQHRITFKHPIVVAVITSRFSSRIMFFVGFIPKLYFHVRFPFRTEPNKNRRCRSNTKTVLLSNPCFRSNNCISYNSVSMQVIPKRYYFNISVSRCIAKIVLLVYIYIYIYVSNPFATIALLL